MNQLDTIADITASEVRPWTTPSAIRARLLEQGHWPSYGGNENKKDEVVSQRITRYLM